MKKTILSLLAASIIFISGCEKNMYINFGFDSPINKNSRGLVIANIDKHVEKLYLHGNIVVSEGEMEVLLVDPDNNVVYTEKLTAPDTFRVDEYINANPGYWKLKYKSYECIGHIDLHLDF